MVTESESLAQMNHPTSPLEPTPQEAAPEVTILRPLKNWEVLNLRELWRYRELVIVLAWRDLKVRYKQTVLGAAWAVLQPLMMMVVFTIFFNKMGGLGGSDDDYPVFVYAGLVPWMFFAGAVATAAQSVLGSERLITKIYFPRLSLPFAAAGAATVDSLIAFGLLLPLMLFFGKSLTWNILLVPLIYFLILLTALGIGTLLAGLHVAYRDFRYVTPFLIQVWMFATPTIYMDLSGTDSTEIAPPPAVASKDASPEDAAPRRPAERAEWMSWARELNPLTGLVGEFRTACLGGTVSWISLAQSAVFAIVLFLVGCSYFRMIEGRFGDII